MAGSAKHLEDGENAVWRAVACLTSARIDIVVLLKEGHDVQHIRQCLIDIQGQLRKVANEMHEVQL